jgi:transposase
VNITQRYEMIRSILKREKSPDQVNKETKTPLSTIYHYLKKFRKGSENIEDLADKSHASHSHPKWLTQENKDKVVQYKLQHPHLSSRQIAKALTKEGILQISNHSVADILKERGLSTPFLSISHLN